LQLKIAIIYGSSVVGWLLGKGPVVPGNGTVHGKRMFGERRS
jgi:hypothetical protein